MLSDILCCYDATILVIRGKHEGQGKSHVLIIVVGQHDEVCIRGNYILLQLALQAQWHHRVLQVWVDVNYEVLICWCLNFHAEGSVAHPLELIARRYAVTTIPPSLLLFFDLEAGRSTITHKHFYFILGELGILNWRVKSLIVTKEFFVNI